MTPTHINSSWIDTIAYVPYGESVVPPVDGTTGFLMVTAQTGDTYAYAVPPWVVGLMMAAEARGESVGRLFNRHIKGQWPSVRVTEV